MKELPPRRDYEAVACRACQGAGRRGILACNACGATGIEQTAMSMSQHVSHRHSDEIHNLRGEIERLRAEVQQCAVEMEEAANLIAPNFPRAATLFTKAAERARATLANEK